MAPSPLLTAKTVALSLEDPRHSQSRRLARVLLSMSPARMSCPKKSGL
jgi:hypothetical protein